MKISIVATLYRSAPTIVEFCRRALIAAEAITDDIEILLVNDGSPDDSRELVLDLQASDQRIVLVDLARNFGHHRAMMTGLVQASGDLVFLIDSDLEEPPELLLRFYRVLAAQTCDVVYGVQEKRRGRKFDRISGEVFFGLVRLLSDQPLPRNLVTARLMKRDYVRALVRHRDREFLIAHLWQITGFTQIPLQVEKLSTSPSTYSFFKRIDMAVKYVTTTSTRLLYMAFYAGTCLSMLAVVTILYYLGRYFISGVGVDGYTSLIVSIWLFGGTTTLCLGIVGIYLATVLGETRRRPYTIIRRIHRHDTKTVATDQPSILPKPDDASG